MSSNGKARLEELDVLRGIAAIGVVLFHYAQYSSKHHGLPFEFPIGTYGLQLFFTISGFVIFWTLERCKAPIDFAFSRFTRLYPTYWTALGVTALVTLAQGKPLWLTSYAAHSTMLQMIMGFKNIDVAYWTLAVELVFYCWIALLHFTGALKRVHLILAAWLIIAAVLSPFTRFWFEPDALALYLLLPFIPYFGAGMLLYVIKRDGFNWSSGVLIALCTAVAFIYQPDYGAASVAAFSLIGLATQGKLTWIVSRPTVWLGTVSYALYATHYYMGAYWLDVLAAAGVAPVTALLIAVLIAVSVAGLITYLVERPAISRLKSLRAISIRLPNHA